MTDLRLWTWPWLIGTTVAKSVLAVVVCLGLWGAAPAAVGWLPTTVSSGSMLPRLHVGDVAVSRPLRGTPPTLGSVLLFDDPDHPDRLRMHRFVRINDDGRLVTRGDANAADDSSPVELSAVHGVGTLRVPWVALPVVWLRERSWLPLGISLAVLAGLTAVAAQTRKFGFPDPAEPATDEDRDPTDHVGGGPDTAAVATAASDTAPCTPSAPTARDAATTVGALVVAIVLGLVGAAPAGAVFTDTAATRSDLAAATYFSCANAVTATTPYLWYRMDESTFTTTAADSSTGDRDGVYSSAGRTRVTRACNRDSGAAMTFNGSSGYLSSPLLRGTAPNTFSIAIWLRTTTTRGGKLLGLGNSQTGVSTTMDRHLYMTNTGRIVFGVYPSTVKTVTSPAAYNDGDWHHLVATLSGAGMRLYLDGELVASDATVTTGEPISSSYLRIAYDNIDGWPSAPTSRYFAGTLDDAVFTLSALSASQVQAQYEAGS